jgi:DNA-binding transcriptional regulator PaaX
MTLAIEPCPVPSPKRTFEGKIEEAITGAGLEIYAPNNLSVGGTWLVLQEDIVFEKRKVRRNLEENLTKMNKNGDLKNGVRMKMNKLNLVMV